MKVWGIGCIVEPVKMIGEVAELLHSSILIDLFCRKGKSFAITNRVIRVRN